MHINFLLSQTLLNSLQNTLLHGFFEGNVRVEILALFFFRSVANRSQVVGTHERSYVHAYNDT